MKHHETSSVSYDSPATITGQIAGIFAMSQLCSSKPRKSLREEWDELMLTQNTMQEKALANH